VSRSDQPATPLNPINLRAARARRLFLGEEEIIAARRLLSLLAFSDDNGGRDGSQGVDAVQQARAELALRQRRVHILGERFRAEPPFVLLLALFATEHQEPKISKTRLAQLSWVAFSTLERWLPVLIGEGWVKLSQEPGDNRRVFVSLSDNARIKLTEIFS